MQTFYYHDKDSLQSVLEQIALDTNDGVCESYNYCQFCTEPRCIIRKSKTPCADAFIASGVNYVRCINSVAVEGKENYRKLVKFKAKRRNK